jgi:hypothetical protein
VEAESARLFDEGAAVVLLDGQARELAKQLVGAERCEAREIGVSNNRR